MSEQKVKFPNNGIAKEELLPLLETLKSNDARWQDGRTFSLVFYPGEEVAEVIEAAYNHFFYENGLNPTAFPSVRKFETEVVAMAADLLKGDGEVVGNMTTGGTESILMAVKCARDKARAERPEITRPEMVLPVSAHPAFQKAAHYFDVKPVMIPVKQDRRADVAAMEKAISPNTILVVGSAPAYPHGVVDPIEEIAALAQKHNLLCHVDACVGGFMLPFVEMLGYSVPKWNFEVPGVTSISCDVHKYGYAAKGASLVLYKNSELRKSQYFVYTDWPGGIYASPTMTGTRSAGSIAAAWAVLKFLGKPGYLNMADKVMTTTTRLIEGINKTPGLEVISNPDMSVFAFTSNRYDIFQIGDEMTQRGWHLDRQQFPNSLHLTVSQIHAEIVEQFLEDLFHSVAAVRRLTWNKISSNITVSVVKSVSKVLPEKTFSKLAGYSSRFINLKEAATPARTAAMYGITTALSNRGDVYQMVLNLLDGLNKID